MGTFDIPAEIDYVLNATNGQFSKIAAFIGHSEGTTQFFVGASLKHEYFKEKVGLFIGLAPIVRLDNAKNELMVLAS